ncbi:MAG TPA: hypothetical protein VNN72_24680 [Polyangiaceae bacterium]|nr:hypothetical protein [Polyangiaceae bacterium]
MEARPGSSAALFASLAQLRKSWIKGGWSWDSRYSCVASSFNVEMEADARAVVLAYLPHEWTSKTIASGPAQAKELAETTGGVRPDQRLYTMDQLGRLVAFGLWWPWGDEITISLRIGLGGYVGEPDLARLKETFGALD